ncbi:hypothetical protein WR25_24482 [Diploscapter pachys]|uniref:ABC-2 type transporter transmembrane domain-containing protein n=1 Tax=Diploscapter pachys TaxID=2018661 RepID=A0A2A2J516_9BILA|nr:hypothetical protein WR25_24482 [Diploscapter pachys]
MNFQLNEPFRQFAYLKELLLEYPGKATDFQKALHQSQLSKAAENLLIFLDSTAILSQQSISWFSQFRSFLEHAFSDISDPNSFGNLTTTAVEQMTPYLDCMSLDRFRFVSTAHEMEETAVCLQQYNLYYSGLVFDFDNSDGEKFSMNTSYQIRHVTQMVDSTMDMEDQPRLVFDRNSPFYGLRYLTYGFSFLQEAVDRAIIQLITGAKPDLGVYFQQEPFPSSIKNVFTVENFLGFFVLMSFIVPGMMLVKNIVHEKEMKLKEHMRIMGLGDSIHFISWATVSFVINFISISIVAMLLVYGHILQYTDYSLLMTLYILYMFSWISFSSFLTTFYSNANYAGIASCFYTFLFAYPYHFARKHRSPFFIKLSLMLPSSCLGFGSTLISKANEIDEAHWDKLHKIYHQG